MRKQKQRYVVQDVKLSAAAFGHPGAGGSLGFADPENQIGYGYIPNRKGTTMGGDPRDVALRRALFSETPACGGSISKQNHHGKHREEINDEGLAA